MTSEGNVADTGILKEAQQLMQDGSAASMGEALKILMENAERNDDKVKIQKKKKLKKLKESVAVATDKKIKLDQVKIMNKQSIELLLDDCDSDEPTRQAGAILDLVDAEVYEAAPKIVRLLKSPDAAIRFTAAEALGYLGREEVETVAPALMNLLDDEEELVRSGAVEALGDIDYTPAVESIEYLLRKDPSALVRASAAETLGYLEEASAIETLELSLLDPNEDEAVRCYAANSIGLLGTPQLLPKLEKYLNSDLPLPVKAELLGARYWLGAKEDIEKLVSLLDNADEDFAQHILTILTDLTEREPAPNLAKDAPDLEKVLSAIALRFPLMWHQAEAILAQ